MESTAPVTLKKRPFIVRKEKPVEEPTTPPKRQRAKNRTPDWTMLAVGTEVSHEVASNKWTATYCGPKDTFEWRGVDGVTTTGSLHGFAMAHLEDLNTRGLISRKKITVNAWTETYFQQGDGKAVKMDTIRT